MSNKQDMYYAFNLTNPINCEEDAFAVMVEQSGDRIHHSKLPE